MYRLKSFSESEWAILNSLLSGGSELTDGGVTAQHYHQAAITIEDIVSAVPGSPSQGEYYLFDENSSTEPNKIAYYDGSGWSYYTPVDGTELLFGIYKVRYNYDRWVKHFEFTMEAITNDQSGTGDSAVMSLDKWADASTPGTVYPTLDFTGAELWDVDIEISAMPAAAIDLGNSTYQSGRWYRWGHIGRNAGDSSAWVITNSTGSYFAGTFYTTPAITIDVAASHALKITVEHTASTDVDVKWIARIKGVAGTGYVFYENIV